MIPTCPEPVVVAETCVVRLDVDRLVVDVWVPLDELALSDAVEDDGEDPVAVILLDDEEACEDGMRPAISVRFKVLVPNST